MISEPVVRTTAAAYGVDPDTAIGVYRERERGQEQHPDVIFGEIHARPVTDWFELWDQARP